MGAEVSLVGIRGASPEYAYPRVVDVCTDLGFGGLFDSLDNTPGDLLEKLAPQSGFTQFRICNPTEFIRYVRDYPQLWDSVGFGFEAGLKHIEENPDLTWWFHVYW